MRTGDCGWAKRRAARVYRGPARSGKRGTSRPPHGTASARTGGDLTVRERTRRGRRSRRPRRRRTPQRNSSTSSTGRRDDGLTSPAGRPMGTSATSLRRRLDAERLLDGRRRRAPAPSSSRSRSPRTWAAVHSSWTAAPMLCRSGRWRSRSRSSAPTPRAASISSARDTYGQAADGDRERRLHEERGVDAQRLDLLLLAGQLRPGRHHVDGVVHGLAHGDLRERVVDGDETPHLGVAGVGGVHGEVDHGRDVLARHRVRQVTPHAGAPAHGGGEADGVEGRRWLARAPRRQSTNDRGPAPPPSAGPLLRSCAAH